MRYRGQGIAFYRAGRSGYRFFHRVIRWEPTFVRRFTRGQTFYISFLSTYRYSIRLLLGLRRLRFGILIYQRNLNSRTINTLRHLVVPHGTKHNGHVLRSRERDERSTKNNILQIRLGRPNSLVQFHRAIRNKRTTRLNMSRHLRLFNTNGNLRRLPHRPKILYTLTSTRRRNTRPKMITTTNTYTTKRNSTIPLGIQQTLSTPQVQLVTTMLKGRRQTRHRSTLIRNLITRVHSNIRLMSLPHGLRNKLLHTLIRRTILTILARRQATINHRHLFPTMVMSTRLIGSTIPIHVSHRLLARTMGLIPYPVIVQSTSVLFLRRYLVSRRRLQRTFRQRHVLFPLINSNLRYHQMGTTRVHFQILLRRQIRLPRKDYVTRGCGILKGSRRRVQLLPRRMLTTRPFNMLFSPSTTNMLSFRIKILYLGLFGNNIGGNVMILTQSLPVTIAQRTSIRRRQATNDHRGSSHHRRGKRHNFPMPTRAPTSN